MPMVLRARKTRRRRRQQQDESEEEALEPATPRRSTRLPSGRRRAYEESSDSDSDSVMDQESAEAAVTDLKHCSIVLDRLRPTNNTKEDLDEREDMNRKGGKPVSRIPTFHKRPSGVSHTPEPPALRKETQLHVAPPPEKTKESGSAEPSKSREDVQRETAAPSRLILSVRNSKISLKSPTLFSTLDQATSTSLGSIITPKSLNVNDSTLEIVSPRPALRSEQGPDQSLPRRDQSKAFHTEAAPELSLSHLPPSEDMKETYNVLMNKSAVSYDSCGDNEKILNPTAVSKEEAIINEEPPWEKEHMHIVEPKDSRSSSEAEGEDIDEMVDNTCEAEGENEGYLVDNTCEANGLDPENDIHEHLRGKSEFFNLADKKAIVVEPTSNASPEKFAKAGATKSAKSSDRCILSLLCILPTALLLLGGVGHVWQYGVPMSVSQLTDQLELHWLEGFFPRQDCSSDCRVHLVESIPVGLYQTSLSSRRSVADSWLHLLDKANQSVHIAAFYVTLRAGHQDHAGSSDSQGKMVFEQLKHLKSKGVKLQIAVNAPQTSTQDTTELAAAGAEVREVNLKAVTGGIVHTKMWVVDQKHFYIGSANMDWRSLSQVKEVGLSVEDCSCLAQDAFRVFGVYWNIGSASNGSLPLYWPARLSAVSNSQNPLQLKFNGVPARVYMSSSPPPLASRGRADDLTTILSVMADAQRFIYVSVMDLLPLSKHTEPIRFWPAIDSALRSAACSRGVQIRLLVSCWSHSPGPMFPFLQALLLLNRAGCDIQVKVFRVPSTVEQMKIPFARVNHAKYMVTDRVVYIGTSNWSESYFTDTAGVGVVVNQTGSEVNKGQETLQSQSEELFLRDWTSQHASYLHVDQLDVCPH